MEEYLNTHAYIEDSDIEGSTSQVYLSREDNSYVGMVGLEMEGLFKFLKEHGVGRLQTIKGCKVACLGFSHDEQKWYGWSHRGVYGFGIGSEVKKGDCAYTPVNKDDFLDDMVNFWSGDNHINVKGKHDFTEDGQSGVTIEWEYDNLTPNQKIRGTISGSFSPYPDKYGFGQWTAKTLEDAKEMASDFSNGVG